MKLSHLLLVIVLALGAGYVGAALSPSDLIGQKVETPFDRVVKTGTLRCGYGITPSLLEVDPNTKQLRGFDYDLWQAIGEELGVKVEWAEEAGWGNFIEGLNSNRYDAFCSQLWVDESRAKYLTISKPALYSSINIYARADDTRFDNNLDAISNPSVIVPVVEGDVSVTMARTKFPEARTLVLPQTATVGDMVLSVQTRKADILYLDQGMAAAALAQHQGLFKKVPGLDGTFVYAGYYGFKQGDYALRDMINLSIDKLINDGTVARLAAKYSPDYGIPALGYQQK